jgi:histidinol-phosphate aminotransferase
MSQKIIYLDRNENNYGPAPACFEALRKADLTTISWYDRSYVKGIKGVLSSRLARDFGVPEERILLGYGAETILKQIVQCYLGKGLKLMVPAYSWWYYKLIASEVGGISIEYPLVMGDDQFHYDLRGMRELYVRESPAMVFISSPNNPTGNSLPIPDLKEILAEFRNSIVVLDEAYKYGNDTAYVKDLVEANPNLLVARTFSKYYALAGMRIGFAIMGANLTAMSKFANRYLGFNRLAEDVATAALDSPEYYAGVAQKMRADMEQYYTALAKLPGVRVFRSDANFILAEIPKKHVEPMQKYMKDRGLIIKFMNEPLLNSHVRITIGTQEENRMVIDAMTAYFG